MFYLIGIGLKPEHISQEAIAAIKKCGKIFLDSYTSTYSAGKILQLEKILGKKIKILCRKEIEQLPEKWLFQAKKTHVALLVYGNALTATTHISLLKDCKKNGIKFAVIPGISISNFVAFTGLDEYKFGRIVSIVFASKNYSPESFFSFIEKNQSIGLHSLCLLDIDAEKKKFMKINEAIDLLQAIESKKEKKIISNALLIGVACAGAEDMKIKIGNGEQLKKINFGKQPHALIVCAQLTEIEKENLKELFGFEE